MFKKLTAAIISVTMAVSFVPVLAAVKTAANIGEWEDSYWSVGTGATAGKNGVVLATDQKKSGSASAKMFLETKATDYEATLKQSVNFEDGKYYRITGNIYYNGSSPVGFYKLNIGDHEIKKFNVLAGSKKGEWVNFSEVFRYGYKGADWSTADTTYSKNVIFTMTGKGDVYFDDLSVKEVTLGEGGNYTETGSELIKNGGFEEDFIVPGDVTGLKAEAANGSITLKWTNPEKVAKINIYDTSLLASLASDKTEYFMDGLTNGTEYTYTVKTANKLGMESAGVTVKGIPHPPYTLPNIIKDDDENRIIGINTDMEYSFDQASWQSYDASNPPVLEGDVTVYVRFKSAYEGVTAPVQVLYFTANSTSESGITLEKATILENTLTVAGKIAGGENKKITLTAVKKGADKRDYDNILAVSQTTGAAEGAFSFVIPLADERKGNLNDGRYTIYVDGKNVAELAFAASTTRNSKIAELLASDTPITVITSNKDVFDTLGLYPTDFETLSTSETNSVLKAQLAGLAADDAQIVKKLQTAAANAMLITAPKDANSEEMLTLLKHYAETAQLAYNSVSAADTIAEGGEKLASILTYMSGKAQTTLDDVKKNYCGGAALYYINAATYGEITELIKNNKDYLSLASTEYDTYVSFTGDRAVEAAKTVVSAKNVNKFKSGADIITAMRAGNAKAYEIIINTNPIGGGGGGGGNNGGGKTFITVGDKTPESQIQTEPFGDLANAAWAKESIMKLYNRKIVSGYGDNSFAPEKTITREEYVKILISAFNLYDESAECDFDDVAKDAWYYKYIASAVKAGIVGGISETEFGTGRNITREDIAVLTYKCLQAAGVEFAKATLDFSDGDTVAEYAREAVAAMKDKGIISGYEDGSFKSKQTATRAEACRICAIALEITEGRTL